MQMELGVITFEGENKACLHKINNCGAGIFTMFYRLEWDESNIITNYQVATSWASPHFAGTVSLDGMLNINLF